MNKEEEEFNNYLEQQKQHKWEHWDRDKAWREAQLKQTEETNPWKTG